jgi:hypothetical protein
MFPLLWAILAESALVDERTGCETYPRWVFTALGGVALLAVFGVLIT